MKQTLSLCLALAVATFSVAQVEAANVYTITENQSQLNLTVGGNFLGGSLIVTEQNPSAVTRYNGTIAATFPGTPNVGGSINFPGGGAANAVNPRGGIFNTALSFTPNVNGGSGGAAANYGVNLTAPVDYALPDYPIQYEGIDLNLKDLGKIQSFNMSMAIRDLTLDVVGGPASIGAGGAFDASQAGLEIVSGFADINGSLVFKQDNVLATLAAAAIFQALASASPELGITVNTNFLQSTVSVGLGTRVDLAAAAGTALANTTTSQGSVSFVDVDTPSNLVLPVNAMLPLSDIGLPVDFLDLQLSLDGVLRGTGMIVEVPEPSSIALAGLAVGALAWVGVRRRK